jgi:HD-like signal output (HDOD) protein
MPATATLDKNAVVAKALSLVSDIATLPEVTMKIIEVVENPKSTARELHEVIKRDPALSAKVLKVVNSAFYGLPGQIASVDRAIVLLGLSAVKNIAIASSIARLFKGGTIGGTFTAKDLWKHSVAVAVAAKLLAKAGGAVAGGDEVFLAGLIHDLGIMIERQAFAPQLTEIIERCIAGEGSFIELETRIIGADHQALGDGLTTKWRFPRHLRAAVGFHHNPNDLSADLQPLGRLVHVADTLCCQEKLGFYLTGSGQELSEETLEAISITPEQLEQVRQQLADEVANAEAVLSNESS